MQFFVVFASVLALALAKPGNIIAPVVVPIGQVAGHITSQYHAQDGLGQYSYGYANPLSAKNEIKTADGVTRGAYSYFDAEGKLQSVEYSSDAAHGFRVAASNLPVAPALPVVPAPVMPVPVSDTPAVVEAKTKHLAALEEARIRSVPMMAEVPVNPGTGTEISKVTVNSAPVIQTYGYGINSIYGVNPSIISQPLIPGYVEQPHISTYIAQPIAPVVTSYVSQPIVGGIIGQLPISARVHQPELPVAPVDLPEVVKARAEHLAAVEQVKSRN